MNSISKTLTRLTQIVRSNLVINETLRGKKVKSGGSASNRRRITPGKHRRLYVNDGMWVEDDHLLVRQLGLQFYPGENVSFFFSLILKIINL